MNTEPNNLQFNSLYWYQNTVSVIEIFYMWPDFEKPTIYTHEINNYKYFNETLAEQPHISGRDIAIQTTRIIIARNTFGWVVSLS